MARVAYNYLFIILIESLFVFFEHYVSSFTSWESGEMVGFFIQCAGLLLATLALLSSWKFNSVNPNEVANFYNQTIAHGEHHG